MNAAAQHTVRNLPDIVIAYGYSDEYSFVFHKSTTLFDRRKAKISSTVVSTFTAAYVHLWSSYFTSEKTAKAGNATEVPDHDETTLLSIDHLPTFDARAICYPSVQNLRDYLSWRQADCHINNLYNTTFWALVQHGDMTNTEAEEHLKGTLSADKNEILFSRFGINYNNETEVFRKGSVVLREYALVDADVRPNTGSNGRDITTDVDEQRNATELSKTQQEKIRKARQKARVIVCHLDIIKDEFWEKRPWLLSGKPGTPLTAAPTDHPGQ